MWCAPRVRGSVISIFKGLGLSAQPLDFCAQLGDFGGERADCLRDFDFRKARRNVLRAVPVVTDNVDHIGPFRGRLIIARHQRREKGRVFIGLDNARPAQNLQAAAVRIVHQEQ